MAVTGSTVNFGEYALKATEAAWLTSRQIEAARRAMVRYMRRGGKVWIRVFADKPVTKKPLETRMGKGKGAVDHYVAVTRRGRMLFELGGVSEELAREGLRLAASKLPISCKIVTRADFFMHTAT